MSVRVLMVSDAPLYREAVARTLAGTPAVDVVGTAGCRQQTLECVQQLVPDVVLMDMGMPDAFDAARQVALAADKTRVVALAVAENEADVLACVEAGVAGYVPRSGSLSCALEIIAGVARGETRYSQRIVDWLLRRIAVLAAERQDGSSRGKGAMAGLTAREAEILGLLRQGLPNKMISRRLGIELATVKNHVHNVFCKLGLRSRTEAVVLAQGAEPKGGSDDTASADLTEIENLH